jgi:hypothetical protein
MRRKLIYSLYIYPFLMGAFILIAKLTFWPSINWFLVPAIWAMILLASLLVQKRYVSSVYVHSEKLQVAYYTPFLVQKNWSIDLHLVTDIRIEKGILGGFGTLNIIMKGKWHSFEIYNKAMAVDLEQKLASANMGFTSCGLRNKG